MHSIVRTLLSGDIFGMAASGFFNAPFVRSLFFFIGGLPANKKDIVGCLRNKDHVSALRNKDHVSAA